LTLSEYSKNMRPIMDGACVYGGLRATGTRALLAARALLVQNDTVRNDTVEIITSGPSILGTHGIILGTYGTPVGVYSRLSIEKDEKGPPA
jgi:hypothetical protein